MQSNQDKITTDKINIVKYCFLHKVLSVDGNATHCQIVENIPNTLTVVEKTIPLNDLWSYNNDQFIRDFSIEENGMLQCNTDVDIQNVSKLTINTLERDNIITKPEATNIYDLFLDIVDCEGSYVDSSVKEYIGKDEMIAGVIKFLPRFSASTMTVSISIKLEDGWKTRKLIYEENGILEMNEFMFMVDSKYEHKFNSYEIEKVSTITFSGKEKVIYKVTEDIGVFAYTALGLKLYPKLIAKYQSLSEMYNMLLGDANFLLSTVVEEKEPEVVVTKKSYSSRYNKYYVKFKPYYKAINKADREYIYDLVFDQFVPAISKGTTYSDIIEYLENNHLRYEMIENIKYMLTCVASCIGVTPEDTNASLIVQCKSDIETFNKGKFKADVFLYAIRSCLFIFNIDEKQLDGLEDCIIVSKNTETR